MDIKGFHLAYERGSKTVRVSPTHSTTSNSAVLIEPGLKKYGPRIIKMKKMQVESTSSSMQHGARSLTRI